MPRISTGCSIEGLSGLGRYCEVERFEFMGGSRILIRYYSRKDLDGNRTCDVLEGVTILTGKMAADSVVGFISGWVKNSSLPEVLIMSIRS